MVNIDRLLTLGLIGGAAYAFIRLGGAAGIGQRIGGGFESLFTGITTGITKGITGNDTIATQGTKLDRAIEQKEQDLGRPLTSQEIIDLGKTVGPVEAEPVATAFAGAVERGTVEREFAAKYSFQPPVPTGVMDVSKTFAFISKPDSSLNLARRQASTANGVGFGGYGSALAQQSALERAIQESARKYPEYFG